MELHFLNILGHLFLLNLKQIGKTLARAEKAHFPDSDHLNLEFQVSGAQRYYLPGSYLLRTPCVRAEAKAPRLSQAGGSCCSAGFGGAGAGELSPTGRMCL